MKRFFLFPLGVAVWFIWYVANPSFFYSRIPIRFSDGHIDTPGPVTWLSWFFSKNALGQGFRHFLVRDHPAVFIHYIVVFLLAQIVIGTVLGYQRAKYSERIKSGTPVQSLTLGRRIRLAFGRLFGKGIDVNPYQRLTSETETRHFLFLGGPGTGKTNTILRIVDQILDKKNNDKIFVIDTKGDYTSFYGDPNMSVLLSPLDERSPAWAIGREMISGQTDHITNALIIDTPGQDPVWNLSAKAALSVVMKDLYDKNRAFTLSDLAKALTFESVVSAAKKWDTNLFSIMKDPSSDIAKSVFFVLDAMSKNLLRDGHNSLYSIKDFIFESSKKMTILKAGPLQQEGFDALSRVFFSCLYAHAMMLPELSAGQRKVGRLWVIADELATMKYFPPLIDATERGRSKGLIIVGGTQDWGSIEKFYGEQSRSLFTSFGNKTFFRTPDPNSASYYSKASGEIVVDRVSVTPNRTSVFSLSPAVTTQITTETRPVILAGDIQNLEAVSGKIHAFTQILGFPTMKLSWPILKKKGKWPVFVPQSIVKKSPSKTVTVVEGASAVTVEKERTEKEKDVVKDDVKEEKTKKDDIRDYVKIDERERFHPEEKVVEHHGVEKMVEGLAVEAMAATMGVPLLIDGIVETRHIVKEEAHKKVEEKIDDIGEKSLKNEKKIEKTLKKP